MMLDRPDPLPFYERVWLRQTNCTVHVSDVSDVMSSYIMHKNYPKIRV